MLTHQLPPKMGGSDSGLGVKAGVDSIFDQLESGIGTRVNLFSDGWSRNWSRNVSLESESESRLVVRHADEFWVSRGGFNWTHTGNTGDHQVSGTAVRTRCLELQSGRSIQPSGL